MCPNRAPINVVLTQFVLGILLSFAEKRGIMTSLPFSLWQQGEVSFVEFFITFFVSIAASVAGYYICKWLDRRGKGK